MSLGRGFSPFLLGHRCQALDFLDIQSQAFSHATAIIWIGLVKHSGLPQLDAFLGPTQVIHDVAGEHDGIESYSEGEPPRRFVVLSRVGGTEEE